MGMTTICILCFFFGSLCGAIGMSLVNGTKSKKYLGYYEKYDGEIYALLYYEDTSYGVALLRLSDNRVFIYDNDYFNSYTEDKEGKTVRRFKYVEL